MRVLYSEEGTQQGDPAGPLYFALALHPALYRLQAALGEQVYILVMSFSSCHMAAREREYSRRKISLRPNAGSSYNCRRESV